MGKKQPRDKFLPRNKFLHYVQQKVWYTIWKLHGWCPWWRKVEGDSRYEKSEKKWEWETGRRVGEKKKKPDETWEEMHLPQHSWARCRVGLSHGIWLEILVLSVSSKQKIGHILFNTATAWHSFTVEHNTHYRTWQHGQHRITQHVGIGTENHLLCVFRCSC